MKRVLGVAAGLILLGGLFVTRASGSSESDAATAAQSAAKAWLAETDGGRYGESWEHAAELMRKAILKADWEKALSGARGSLGAVKSRTLRSATYSKTLPNAPAGEYVVILYDTTFEKKGSAVETVTPMREKDGAWRVSGYYIQ